MRGFQLLLTSSWVDEVYVKQDVQDSNYRRTEIEHLATNRSQRTRTISGSIHSIQPVSTWISLLKLCCDISFFQRHLFMSPYSYSEPFLLADVWDSDMFGSAFQRESIDFLWNIHGNSRKWNGIYIGLHILGRFTSDRTFKTKSWCWYNLKLRVIDWRTWGLGHEPIESTWQFGFMDGWMVGWMDGLIDWLIDWLIDCVLLGHL